ncbi:hypothetical protein [Stigmatella erecta]|uniref:Uncharacterized protein n=1 Tax=Stigmatella erecta TaxID=83460 RepID=A0A1I0LBQ3_9BACT|nr:hypothetical protein [Stigmatella erecta]SEU36961.1 hypothetical protein SAMN05443639_12323 [Stigmatella erecta]
MAGATAAEVAAMDKRDAEIRAALAAADEAVGVWALLPSFMRTGAQDAALANLETARQRYLTWAGTWRQWALKGEEPDGYPYTESFYLEAGALIAREVGGHVSAYESGGMGHVVEQTAEATAGTVADAGKAVVGAVAEPWSLRTKLAVGGAVGLVGVGFVAWLVRPYLAVAEKLTGREGW